MDTTPHSKAAPHLAMFINMLSLGSLMMVMPLGPDFVRHLGMAASHVGYVSGGATLAAACRAALSAPCLERLGRKTEFLNAYSADTQQRVKRMATLLLKP